ncbi:DUF4062 domain-containing protein [Chryseobacterium turcicum]|uniref:DUF4062 domain-containing protein n=1 Tax=Chryseobacterium turcicum TaxID=2898076 RepID=A0A9Q3YYW1_9FLAO|nr:DUF4062 domain-containing protein [Chryseobacterium turcicum]MCD1117150.1 DUF4062 domain-containing protein [Chryseobacterium turcicum]
MAKNITKYTIFLGSPGDLEEERFEVENVIKEINLTYGYRDNLVLELLKWETHSAPGITDTYTQDLISKDIGNDYDIFIGMIWQKFGTKTNVANSGTEEEFLNAIKRFENKENIQILFYFKNKPPLRLDDINIEELSKIKKFKEVLKENNVFYSSFNDVDDLKTSLRIHLPKRIDNLKSFQPNYEKGVILKNSESEDFNDNLVLDEDYGVFDYLVEFESLLMISTNSILNINESTKNIGIEFAKKSEEIERLINYPNPNKFQMIDLFKKISKLMDGYSDKVKIENSIFYNNFQNAIDIGLKYINSMEDLDKEHHKQNLESILIATEGLYKNIPFAIQGMSGFQATVKTLPRLQSNLNASKRKLDKQLDELIFNLEGIKNLTGEFINEIKYKLSRLI